MTTPDQLAMWEAYSFQWAYKHLDGLLANPLITNDPEAASGCFMASTLLRPFATELALKALYIQETGGERILKHDLKVLFQSLKPATQTSIEQRFERIRQDKVDRGIYSGEGGLLSQVLANHGNDFTEWRYIYEHAHGASTKPTVLNSLLEAVIEEYQSRQQLKH